MHRGRLNADRVAALLKTKRVGAHITIVDDLDSTNRHILERDAAQFVDGEALVAERQTAGRGRRGRNWSCPNGAGLLCTVGIQERRECVPPALYALSVPLAICEGLEAATDVRAEIKWPNDVVVNRRKLAGVLIEASHCAGRPTRYALGFGVNCLQRPAHFPPELRAKATSLDIESSRPIDRTAVLAAILNALDRYVADPSEASMESVCQAWRRRATGLGERVRIDSEGSVHTGNLLDIDPTAAIVIQLDEGGRRLFDAASTVHFELLD